jgi:hypothetical protein
MTLRAQLSLFALESRENPGDIPTFGPLGDPAPPLDPEDPGLNNPAITNPTAPTNPGYFLGSPATLGADIMLELSSIFNQPLVQW